MSELNLSDIGLGVVLLVVLFSANLWFGLLILALVGFAATAYLDR